MKSIKSDSSAQIVGFFISLMLVTIVALQVCWPVVDSAINSQTCQNQLNEQFNVSGNEDVYMSLTYSSIVSGSEVVSNATFTGTRAVDYNMNYTDGKIQPLSTGGLNFNVSNGSTVYEIDYDHSCRSATANMSAPATALVNMIGLFIVLSLMMMYIKPLL